MNNLFDPLIAESISRKGAEIVRNMIQILELNEPQTNENDEKRNMGNPDKSD